MPRDSRTTAPVRDPARRALVAARVLAGLCVALALMCAGLAWAWKSERDQADCWRAFAEYQLQPQGACGG